MYETWPLSSLNSIKTFDFSILYIHIPHSQLKERLKELVQLCFLKKNVQRRCKYLDLGRYTSYLVNQINNSPKKFSETAIIKTLDNIFVVWWTCFSTDSPMCDKSKCAPLLADFSIIEV